MTFLERVARAVNPGWDHLSANSRRNALITVRETLRAAREPSEKMLEVGGRELSYNYPATIACWQGMIDMAIEETIAETPAPAVRSTAAKLRALPGAAARRSKYIPHRLVDDID